MNGIRKSGVPNVMEIIRSLKTRAKLTAVNSKQNTLKNSAKPYKIDVNNDFIITDFKMNHERGI